MIDDEIAISEHDTLLVRPLVEGLSSLCPKPKVLSQVEQEAAIVALRFISPLGSCSGLGHGLGPMRALAERSVLTSLVSSNDRDLLLAWIWRIGGGGFGCRRRQAPAVTGEAAHNKGLLLVSLFSHVYLHEDYIWATRLLTNHLTASRVEGISAVERVIVLELFEKRLQVLLLVLCVVADRKNIDGLDLLINDPVW